MLPSLFGLKSPSFFLGLNYGSIAPSLVVLLEGRQNHLQNNSKKNQILYGTTQNTTHF
jgi:hypothetical protein